ncbi:MAG: hypothetical protein AAF705_15535 [Bacteroidota bacterium]
MYTLFMLMVYTLLDYRDAVGVSFQEIAVDKIPMALLAGMGFTVFMFLLGIYSSKKES